MHIQNSISIGDQITPPDCKNPWKNFRRDFCIRFYSKSSYKTTFDSAQAECKEQDGTLFEPRSVDGKFNFIYYSSKSFYILPRTSFSPALRPRLN